MAIDLYRIGGVPVLIKALLDGGYLHGDCLTVTGRTLAENRADVRGADRPGHLAAGQPSVLAERRRGRPEGLARAGGRDLQGGRT